MRTSLAVASIAVAALLTVPQAHAAAITFDELAVGSTLATQYAGLGVVFVPNALSGASPGPGGTWATNTDMTIVSSTGPLLTGRSVATPRRSIIVSLMATIPNSRSSLAFLVLERRLR